MNIAIGWSYICPVEIAPLLQWVEASAGRWPEPSTPCKPSRIQGDRLPMDLVDPITAQVLAEFDPAAELHGHPGKFIAAEPMLSRMLPGQSHGYHVDTQRADCVTRVHVPITTNPDAWIAFESLIGGLNMHLEAGHAYTFNTALRHAFGNNGETARVHLIFEVLRCG